MSNRVVISRGDHDIRAAFIEEGKLVEFHREHLNNKSTVGNIYRGIVQDVIPGLQAAFIDVGLERNMFLHFMDVRAESLVFAAPNLDEALAEAAKTVIPGRIVRQGRRPKPDLRAGGGEPPLKKGDTIIVQVVKDGISDKAPRVTANLALAGRYLVLLPFPSQSGGVSRRVAMGQDRMKLKKLLHDLKTDQYSFIVRTAGLGVEEEQIRSDVELLREQWENIVSRFRELKKPGLVHSDHNIVERLVRDVFIPEIGEILVDDAEIADELRRSLDLHMPELSSAVVEYDEAEPIFEKTMVESQLRTALQRKVWLKSGGYLIVEETEALTAIDINTGRFTGSRDQEKTSLRTNIEACEAIAHQIRLRDIGGIIVVDFIDMLSRDNQQRVADELKHQMRHDRAKYTVGRMGDFGLVVLTRKRKHQSLQKQMYDPCPYCDGEGWVLNTEEIWRRLKSDIMVYRENAARYVGVVVMCDPTMAHLLHGELAPKLAELEKSVGIQILLRADQAIHREDYTISPIERPASGSVVLPRARINPDDIHAEPITVDRIPAQTYLPALAPGETRTREDKRRDDRRDHKEALTESKRLEAERQRAAAERRREEEARRREQAAARRAAEDALGEAEEIAEDLVEGLEGGAPAAAAAGENGETPKKRTRRGRRGGRRRRGRGKGGEQAVDGQPQLDADGLPIPANVNADTNDDSDEDDDAPEVDERLQDALDTPERPVAPAPQQPGRHQRPPRPERDQQQGRPPRQPQAPQGNQHPRGGRPQQPAPPQQQQPKPAVPPPVAATPQQPQRPVLRSGIQIVSHGAKATPPAAPAKPTATPAAPAASTPAQPRVLRGVQVVGSWGTGPAPVSKAKIEPPKAAEPVAPVAPPPANAPARPRSVTVVSSWGGRGDAPKPGAPPLVTPPQKLVAVPIPEEPVDPAAIKIDPLPPGTVTVAPPAPATEESAGGRRPRRPARPARQEKDAEKAPAPKQSPAPAKATEQPAKKGAKKATAKKAEEQPKAKAPEPAAAPKGTARKGAARKAAAKHEQAPAKKAEPAKAAPKKQAAPAKTAPAAKAPAAKPVAKPAPAKQAAAAKPAAKKAAKPAPAAAKAPAAKAAKKKSK